MLARNSEFARNLLGIRSENGLDQPCGELSSVTFRYFLFFFCSGRGRESRAKERGGRLFVKNPREGGGVLPAGEGGGREGVCGDG